MLLQDNHTVKQSQARQTRCISPALAMVPPVLSLLVLLFLTGFASPASALNFNANWLYRETGGEKNPTRQEFLQRYGLGVGQGLSYTPTHAISASAFVGYNRSQSAIGAGEIARNQLNPTAQLSLVNDIFSAQLSGGSTISWNQYNDRTESRWEVSLGSSWNIPLWPNLRLHYSEFIEAVDDLKLFNATGSKEKNSGIGLNWDLILARFNYSYTTNQNVNPAGRSLAESTSQFARVETDGVFWNKRIRFNLSQQYGYSTRDIVVEDPVDGFFSLPVEGSFSVKVDQVGDPDPTEENLYVDPGNLTLPVDVDTNERIHIRFVTATGFPEQIDILRLSFPDLFTAQQAEDLEWKLYTRTNQFDLWEEEPGVVQGDLLGDDEVGIDIPIGVTATEILIVATNEGADQLPFASFAAYEKVTNNLASKSTSYLTNLGLGYMISKNLRASGSMFLDHSENESGLTSTENDRRGVSGNLRWTPLPIVSPGISFSEIRDEQTGGPERISRNYSLNVLTIPLPSLNVSFIATRSERYIDALQTFFSNRYTLSAKAPIYPDLTASWSLNYSESETLLDDNSIRLNDVLSSRLEFNAKLYKYLTADILTSYNITETSNTKETRTGSAELGLRYRPSAILAMRGNYQTSYGDNSGNDSYNLDLTLGLLNTPKTRLTFTATHSHAVTTSNIFRLRGSWDISRHLSLQGNGNITIGEYYKYGFQVSLALRL